MRPGLLPSLVPVVVVAPLLALIVLRRDGRRWGLAAYCASLGLWALSNLLTLHPDTAAWGTRTLMVGFAVPAAYWHAVREDHMRSEGGGLGPLVPLGYAAALIFIVLGALPLGLFLQDGGQQPGPGFLVMLGAAFVGSAGPLGFLARAVRDPAGDPGLRARRLYLLLAGLLGTLGGGLNILLLLTGHPSPAGLYVVLTALVLLAWVVQSTRLPTFGRFVERSLRYSILAALLTTAFLFAVLVLVRPDQTDETWSWQSWSSALLLFLVVLVGQPLLSWARGWLAGTMFAGQGNVEGMARALAESEARAEHAERLAGIGQMASAVAHEVRNPLGVIAASVRLLERQGADPAMLGEIRQQVGRAERFADELLAYGRPAPLRRRQVALGSAAQVAVREVVQALEVADPSGLTVDGPDVEVSGDLAQLTRLVGILVENAVLSAGAGPLMVQVRVRSEGPGARIEVADGGPGISPDVAERLFEPFVSGRGRAGPRPGTGLGLAIALGIAERHGGRLSSAGPDLALGGACFVVWLPTEPPLPAGG